MRLEVVMGLVVVIAAGCGGTESGSVDAASSDGPGSFDCPDACIPRCHLEALAAFDGCVGAGACTRDRIDDDSDRYCWTNGVTLEWERSLSSNNHTDTYYQNGLCFRLEPEYGGQFNEILVKATLYGRDLALLSVLEWPVEDERDQLTVTCGGSVRDVNLLANRTNAACASCPDTDLELVRYPSVEGGAGGPGIPACVEGTCPAP